jgi:beta-N-acetylhexosaminidase
MRTSMRCGELVIGGFAGTTLPEAFGRAMREGRRGGAILFKPNVEGGPRQVAALARSLHAVSPDLPPIVSVDQEGGRVARLRAPLLEVPPMRAVGSWGDVALAERIAHAVGVELGALGFTVDYAPVLDVDTRPENPVIGDRAFSADPETCARFGVAWTRGLQSAGLLACGKHFPGHGDTTKDSHVDLPVVDLSRDRLERVELAPFRAASEAGLAMIMSAHVVYTALDARPATLSPAASTELRAAIGFEGVLVSDDLEMRAIAARWSVEDAAVLAVAAGCDALLVCWTDALQERAVDALEREAERSPSFRARCEQARARLAAARRRITARPLDDDGVARVVGGEASRAVAAEIQKRLAS